MEDTDRNSPQGEHTPNQDFSKLVASTKLPTQTETSFSGERPLPSLGDVTNALTSHQPEDVPPNTPTHISSSASDVTAIHTLRDDIQHAVHSQQVTLVRAAALEQEKRSSRNDPQPQTPHQKGPYGLIVVSIFLILIASASLYGVVYIATRATGTGTQTAPQGLIFSEQSLVIPLSGSSGFALKSALAQARQDTSDPVGSITHIIPLSASSTDSSPIPASTSEFFTMLQLHPPENLVESVDSTFFFGFHMLSVREPVFIIPVISYDAAIAGMQEWEKTINADFSPLFNTVSMITTGVDGIPTDRVFHTEVIQNYDVRVLSDDTGKPVLYYSFPTPSLLIIASNPYTFPELLTRLQAKRVL